MEKNLFELAVRGGYRFVFRGSITMEDLYILNKSNLEEIYQVLVVQAEKINGKSLLKKKSSEDEELLNKIEIVEMIFNEKVEIENARKSELENAKKKQRLLGLLDKKRHEAEGEMSEEEILAELNNLK